MARHRAWRPNPARPRDLVDSFAHRSANDLCRPFWLWGRNILHRWAGVADCPKRSLPAGRACFRVALSRISYDDTLLLKDVYWRQSAHGRYFLQYIAIIVTFHRFSKGLTNAHPRIARGG